MFRWVPSVQHHQFLGVLSILIGLTFMFERYTVIPGGALDGPIHLIEFIPAPVPGLVAWGILFTVGGIFTFVSNNLLMRLIALCGASFSWGMFAAASLYASWGLHDSSGSALGILFLAGLFRCLQSSSSIWDSVDHPPKKKSSDDTPTED